MRMHDAVVTDDEHTLPTRTVRDWITAAGLSDERLEEHTTGGHVRADGELVTNHGHSRSGRDAGRRLGNRHALSMHTGGHYGGG
jgi:hypothetical protein